MRKVTILVAAAGVVLGGCAASSEGTRVEADGAPVDSAAVVSTPEAQCNPTDNIVEKDVLRIDVPSKLKSHEPGVTGAAKSPMDAVREELELPIYDTALKVPDRAQPSSARTGFVGVSESASEAVIEYRVEGDTALRLYLSRADERWNTNSVVICVETALRAGIAPASQLSTGGE